MMRVKEWDESIIFLHEVTSGAADQSYGIHVAQLAGLPKSVVGRARQVLVSLEEGNKPIDAALLATNPTFFVAEQEVENQPDSVKSAIELEFDSILPDELSPKEALELVYKLKSIGK
jgi:DNA mismatch repair protein MutS